MPGHHTVTIPAIFVVGSPRSGTTLIGRYLATHPLVYYLGDFFGFYYTEYFLPLQYQRFDAPDKRLFLQVLRDRTYEFAAEAAHRQSKLLYCDSTPQTMFAARHVADTLPDAIFVLMLRHYSGVVQSLTRLASYGVEWADQSWEDRARTWARHYERVGDLPEERTIAVSYDRLCSNPEAELQRLSRTLDDFGLQSSALSRRAFGVSHSMYGQPPRQTLGTRRGDQMVMSTVPTFDANMWDDDIERRIDPLVRNVDDNLKARYGVLYQEPAGFAVSPRTS